MSRVRWREQGDQFNYWIRGVLDKVSNYNFFQHVCPTCPTYKSENKYMHIWSYKVGLNWFCDKTFETDLRWQK